MILNFILLLHIDYGCVILGRCPNQVNVDQICKLQKWAAWFKLRCKIQDISSNEIFKNMIWMLFQDRVSYKYCLMMFKVKSYLVSRFMQTFTPVSVVHGHNTRSTAGGDFCVSSAKLKYHTRHFQYMKVLDYGTKLVDQPNSPQVNLFFKSIYIYEELFHTVKYTPIVNDFNCFNPFNCIYLFYLGISCGPCWKLAIH